MEQESAYSLSEELTDLLIEKSNEVIQEMVPVALENDNITMLEIDEFNLKREQGKCYQGIVYPPIYDWGNNIDDYSEISNSDAIENYAEVFFAFMDDDANEPQDSDKTFAVILFNIKNLESGEAFIEWNPIDYELN